MARVKYTGPSSMTKVQEVPPLIMSTTTSASARKQKQKQDKGTQQILSSRQAQRLKQQQSQEMVQIMLHVSVSLGYHRSVFIVIAAHTSLNSSGHSSIFGYTPRVFVSAAMSSDVSCREFLPLPCFGDRDLKFAHRENNVSYRRFINTNGSPPEKDVNVESAFGQGRRGQPLKIIIRSRDPKADTILDLLVIVSLPL
jgi:meiosis-specific protein